MKNGEAKRLGGTAIKGRPNAKAKNTKWQKVSLSEVAALFVENYSRGPWPSESDCYRLANMIDIVRNRKAPPVLNADKIFRRRREHYAAMHRSVKELIEELGQHPDVYSMRLGGLQELKKVLEGQREAFLGFIDPERGERRGAEWHKAAHLIARNVEAALRAAGYTQSRRSKKISRDRSSPFVLVVRDALKLAGLKERTPDAIAAVLAKFPN